MDTQTDITLIKVDEYSNPVEDNKEYSLKSFLNDIKSDKAELRFKIGICEEGENGEPKWVFPNKIWVIEREYVYSRKWSCYHWENVYYMGKTKRNYKEINDLLGYHAITNYNTYL